MLLPVGVLLITAATDVQERYIATLTVGWSEAGELWVLDYERIECNPRDTAVWSSLASYLNAVRFDYPGGKTVPVHLAAIDSGFLTDHVYAAVRVINAQPGRAGRWAFATKGVGGLSGEPLVLAIDEKRDARGRRGQRPLRINVDEGKGEIVAMLRVKSAGPGYVHISRRLSDTGLLAELTSEEQRPKLDASGVVVGTEWKKKTVDARNEALDCAVMSLCLYHYVRREQWLRLLTERHGQDEGLRRFQAMQPIAHVSKPAPGERPAPRPRPQWIKRQDGGWLRGKRR